MCRVCVTQGKVPVQVSQNGRAFGNSTLTFRYTDQTDPPLSVFDIMIIVCGSGALLISAIGFSFWYSSFPLNFICVCVCVARVRCN